MSRPAMTPLASSHVSSAGYDDARRELHVELQGGRRYVYSGVPREAFDDLVAADSAGSHFNREVKGNYSHRPG